MSEEKKEENEDCKINKNALNLGIAAGFAKRSQQFSEDNTNDSTKEEKNDTKSALELGLAAGLAKRNQQMENTSG